jgi:hypothetical protein
VPAGFGVYLLLNWKISAEPFAFLRSRKALFDISAAWPWVGVRGHITHLDWRSPAEAEMIGTQELYFTALGLICVVAAWLKLRPAYAVWMTGSWLLVVSATFIESMPRYMLTMFLSLFCLPCWTCIASGMRSSRFGLCYSWRYSPACLFAAAGRFEPRMDH